MSKELEKILAEQEAKGEVKAISDDWGAPEGRFSPVPNPPKNNHS